MRKNYPITQVEHKLRHDQYLISKTDLKGRITYANPAFIEISGFSRDELMGKAHNIVRHPHVPPAAFQDMWDTLHAGKPWTGIVKNRSKNGDFYWVHALVSPIVEGDQITGYASVRVRPSDEKIRAAEDLYEKVNTNTLVGYTLKEGHVTPTGWRRILPWLKAPFKRSLAQRSSQAAGEIKILIEESVSRMNTGVNQATHAGHTVQTIVDSVQHVNDIIGEISIASEEQATGLHQIHMAISQIDDVTQSIINHYINTKNLKLFTFLKPTQRCWLFLLVPFCYSS